MVIFRCTFSRTDELRWIINSSCVVIPSIVYDTPANENSAIPCIPHVSADNVPSTEKMRQSRKSVHPQRHFLISHSGWIRWVFFCSLFLTFIPNFGQINICRNNETHFGCCWKRNRSQKGKKPHWNPFALLPSDLITLKQIPPARAPKCHTGIQYGVDERVKLFFSEFGYHEWHCELWYLPLCGR